ncbi:hypothetical protein HJB78_27185 [Rhizobium lentis]|uniref:hypothetical protein n=1 Tax=Rhizobium lentis TaxID=1138194 RepID=UPI001C82B54F|nr:hypothetical protein [Rhizobium lentis]MBX5154600.1 hypothetical protein [Rhizobium lentis]
MTKSDFPALRMTIDGGRLIPAGPFDAERLNSYRRGTVVYVRFTEEKDRVLVRKWFAIIGLVLKQCQTPWKNRDQAHEAIKLALGIVNLSKTVGGEYMQYPKSITELEDPELQEALEQMTELLSRMTGVDVATLKKETAHIVDNEDHDPTTGEIIEHESSAPHSLDKVDEPPHPSSAEPADLSPSAGSPNTDTTETPVADLVSADEPSGDGTTPSPSPEARDLETQRLIDFAKDVLPLAANAETTGSVLSAIEKEWAPEIKKMSAEGQEKAKAISRSMRAIFNGNTSLESALDFFADALGSSVEELGG